MSQFYVYVLSDPRDGVPFYVGKGSGWRAVRHVRGQAHSVPVKNKIAKLARGGVQPLLSVTPVDDESHAFFLESCLILAHGRRDQKKGPLLNLTDGGEGMAGWIASPETREKIKRHRNSPERREQLRIAHVGAKRSDETRRKIAEKAKGRRPSEATRAKLSAVQRGKKRTNPEYLARLSAAVAAAHARNPRTHSEETKQKMRAAQQARRAREGWKNGL